MSQFIIFKVFIIGWPYSGVIFIIVGFNDPPWCGHKCHGVGADLEENPNPQNLGPI